jgi:CheY-like chemotaxis protein
MQKNKHIFLVEDDEDDQQFFIEAVKEIDNSICVNLAFNGADALSQLDTMLTLPDIIFMDINMPKMNGLDCLEKLKKTIRLKNIPVVILTSAASAEDSSYAIKHEASHFLTKPSKASLLKGNITEVFKIIFTGDACA